MPDGYYLTPETKGRLDRLLNARPVAAGRASRTANGRSVVLVRCDSETAGDTLAGSVGADSYPGTVVQGEATLPVADLEDGDPVWLSLTDGSVPEVDMIYTGVLAGDVEIDGELLPRAFAQPAGAGGGGGTGLEIYRNSYSAAPFSGYDPVQSGGAAFYVRVPHATDYWVWGVLAIVAGGGGADVSYAAVEWDAAGSDPTSADTLTLFGLNRVTLGASDRMPAPVSCVLSTDGSSARKVGMAYKVNSGSVSAIGLAELAVAPITILTSP